MTRQPQPTSRDLAAWRRLIREAEKAARDPGAPLGDLRNAAKVARKSCVPSGEVDRSNPFVRLVRKAFQFVDETDFGRKHLCAELAAHAAEGALRMSPPEPGSPRPSASEIVKAFAPAAPQPRLPYAED